MGYIIKETKMETTKIGYMGGLEPRVWGLKC